MPVGADGAAAAVDREKNRDPGVWKEAATWREHLVGSPRIAEEVSSWASGETPEEVFYLPTPGPGDSDGGDIY